MDKDQQMSNSVVQSRGTIPFSWENQPGVSKVARQESSTEGDFMFKLPPPPCPEVVRVSVPDLQIPLPPCAFQPPSRSSSRKGLRKQEDPFLAAYKECTKSTKQGKSFRNEIRSLFRKHVLVFSCSRSCSVRDDNLVRVSQLPYERESESE